jgi:hypothetical protein
MARRVDGKASEMSRKALAQVRRKRGKGCINNDLEIVIFSLTR